MTSANILIIEDESLVAEELSVRLGQLGHGVSAVVDNAADAFSFVSVVRPDLALVDINIKGSVNGIEVARRFREDFDLPVVFLTAHADGATLKEATATEPYGYLVKPFDKRSLAATLQTALRRRGAEDKLVKVERWLTTTMNSIGDAVISIDSLLRVSFINPVGERLTGWSFADAAGRPADEVLCLRTASGETFRDVIEQAMSEGIVMNLDEAELTTRDGRLLPIDDSVAPIRDDAGRITGLVVVFRDATARKQHTQELRQLHTELEDRVRIRTAQLQAANEDLAAFAQSIAHDLRAPLRAINAYTGRVIAEHSTALTSEGQRLLNVVTSRANQMAAMIDDYLRLSGLSRVGLHHEQVDMTQLARECWDTVVAGLPRVPALALQKLPPAFGDAGLLRQVWINLLANAVKFTRNTPAPQVRIDGADDGSRVRYRIADNGVGFDPAFTGKLFRVFERLHGQTEFEGNGIGLCIVQRILHRHEGDVTVDARPNAGATVEFWMPNPRRQRVPETHKA